MNRYRLSFRWFHSAQVILSIHHTSGAKGWAKLRPGRKSPMLPDGGPIHHVAKLGLSDMRQIQASTVASCATYKNSGKKQSRILNPHVARGRLG